MFKKITLKNGLKLFLFQDNTVNRAFARVYSLAGGIDNHFIYDNKEYNLPHGIAHFLEHYLIEKSIYGNMLDYYRNEYVDTNGLTYIDRTCYYISTVHDFIDNYIKLLNLVNNPNFNKEDIDDVRGPIRAEIRRSLDYDEYDYYKFVDECSFHNPTYGVILGDDKDIVDMTIDDIKTFHEAFYQPKNQIIVISGNFNEEEVIRVTEEQYDLFKRDYKDVVRDVITEDLSPVKANETFIDKDKQEKIVLNYKINLSKLTPMEKLKLSFYVEYMLYYNFSDISESFKDIREKGLSIYTIKSDSYIHLDNNVLVIQLSTITSKIDETRELIEEYVKNLKSSKKSFTEFKNGVIINFAEITEDIHLTAKKYLTNYFEYGYDDITTLELIKSFNYEECLEMIRLLDFSNVCCVKRIKGE